LSRKSFEDKERNILPFGQGIVEVSRIALEAWGQELKDWLCTGKEAHSIGHLSGTEALARVALKDESINYDEIYAET
jgi:hypothetical protein